MGGRGAGSSGASGGSSMSVKVKNTFIESPMDASELGEEDELGPGPCPRLRQVSEPVMQASFIMRQMSGHAGASLAGGSAGFIREEEELEEPEEEGQEPETEREPCWLLGQDGKPARQESDNLSSFGSPTTLPRQETEMQWPSWGPRGAAPPEQLGGGARLGEQPRGQQLDHWTAVYHDASTLIPNDLTPIPGELDHMRSALRDSGSWQNAMATTAMEASYGFDASLANAAIAAMQDNRAGGPDAGAGAGVPSPEWSDVYTVMMRNLPNKYTQQMLLEELNKSGFLGTFDFLYLPIDPETNANRGYAFINFINPGSAWMLRMTYEGRKMARFNSDKVVSVSPAALQGFEANYAHYSTARVSRGDPALRPLFLRESTLKSNLVKSGSRRRGGRRSAGSLIDVAARQQQTRAPPAASSMQPKQMPGSAMYFGLNGCGGGAGAKKQAAEMTSDAGGASSGAGASLVPKFCPYCGGKCQPEYRFCKFCGASLALADMQD